MIKHLLFSSHFDFNIIKLPPNILVMILDHGIIVATLFATIMNADTMKVVSFFAQRLENVLQLFLLLLDLVFEWVCLSFDFFFSDL